MQFFAYLFCAMLASGCATMQMQSTESCSSTSHFPVFASDADKKFFYDQWHYAPAIQAGDFVFLSGVPVVSSNNESVMNVETLKAETRVAFAALGRTLEAAGAGYSDIVSLRSYHVFDSPFFDGSKEEQMKLLIEVKDEFVASNYPAWTVLGVDELFLKNAVMEIDIVAYAPSCEA
jgi:enamine deaminase RidA (YjgF/YER057c/UK114 family)